MPKINELNEPIDLEELREIKRLERERLEKIDTGLLPHPLFPRACRVKILMLVDASISYNHAYFGLSEVLDTLRMNPEWWVKFDVTRAHRQTDFYKPALGTPAYALYGPHYENFSFTQDGFDINDYDQVWFYGFNSGEGAGTPPPQLTQPELDVLFRWMNQRHGGVFATGDHETLGESLCSKIPRVRSMRKWKAADGVPPAGGLTRHDTLLKGHDYAGTPAVNESLQYTFDDESDDVPMRIKPRWYHHHHCSHPHAHPHHWYWPFFHNHSPHPVLCGTAGVINILPDHPHEGHVVEPSVLTNTIPLDGANAREYPDLGGTPLAPEVIAWATVQNDHKASDFKGVANPKNFGAVGAYNGHCVDVGRVVVDSTWHHWFDVNLTGRPAGFITTGDPRKQNGFNDTPAGVAALARVQNYFRNVAVWLAPPGKQLCMALHACWGVLHRYPLVEEVHLKTPVWIAGRSAIDALGRFAAQCQVRHWWPIIARPFPLERLFDPRRLLVPVEGLKMIDEFAMGGIVLAMAAARADEFCNGKAPDDKQLLRLGQRGVREGLAALAAYLDEANKTNAHLAEVIGGAVKEDRDSKQIA